MLKHPEPLVGYATDIYVHTEEVGMCVHGGGGGGVPHAMQCTS